MDKLLIIFLLFFAAAANGANFIGGDGFIQLGTFRLGNVDNTHFSISSIKGTQGPKTSIIFHSDGTVHPGPRTDYNFNDKPILDEPINVKFTKHGIEFGEFWCIGMSETDISDNYDHFSITHNNKNVVGGVDKTAMIWRNDGTRHGGPRNDFSCWANEENDVTVGADKSYIQFNNAYRIGTTGLSGGFEHLSIASDRTCVIYRDDGTIHPGPRDDFAWPDWDPDHTRCTADCDDSDACTEDYCDYSSGSAVCQNREKNCNDNNECTEDSCNEITGECINTDIKCNDGEFCNGVEYCDPADGVCKNGINFDCPPNMICSNEKKTCVRDCKSLAIDEYLNQCSDEHTSLVKWMGWVNDEFSYIHDRIDGFGEYGPFNGAQQAMFNNDGYPTAISYFDPYKDEIIIALFLMNMVTMMVCCCYICSNKNNKKYHVVNMQESDDEERPFKK